MLPFQKLRRRVHYGLVYESVLRKRDPLIVYLDIYRGAHRKCTILRIAIFFFFWLFYLEYLNGVGDVRLDALGVDEVEADGHGTALLFLDGGVVELDIGDDSDGGRVPVFAVGRCLVNDGEGRRACWLRKSKRGKGKKEDEDTACRENSFFHTRTR